MNCSLSFGNCVRMLTATHVRLLYPRMPSWKWPKRCTSTIRRETSRYKGCCGWKSGMSSRFSGGNRLREHRHPVLLPECGKIVRRERRRTLALPDQLSRKRERWRVRVIGRTMAPRTIATWPTWRPAWTSSRMKKGRPGSSTGCRRTSAVSAIAIGAKKGRGAPGGRIGSVGVVEGGAQIGFSSREAGSGSDAGGGGGTPPGIKYPARICGRPRGGHFACCRLLSQHPLR